jgi:MerR family transcriptional regulator, light-induced transcriptional regulator
MDTLQNPSVALADSGVLTMEELAYRGRFEPIGRAHEHDRLSGSVYSQLRVKHPQLVPSRLRKSTLLALSWAIEDELAAKTKDAIIFGSFQCKAYYLAAEPRWQELAKSSRAAFVFADFPGRNPEAEQNCARTDSGQLLHVPLADGAPMRHEWSVVCDAVEFPIAMAAYELPGQSRRRERDRVFESVWTLDSAAVRDAARVCTTVATQAGVAAAAALLDELAIEPASKNDLASLESVFNRTLGYVDWFRTV